MSPLVAYHVTRKACRASIEENGLLCNRPTKARPFGVYVFRWDRSFEHVTWESRSEWTFYHGQDLWEVAYIGPLMPDQYVFNALILLRPATHVTLVTGNPA